MITQNPFDSLPVVSAGFASPADDYLDPDLDFNQYLKQNPTSTFAVRVNGDCMKDAHIPHNAMVVFDRSLKPPNNSIVVGVLDGEKFIKHIVRTQDGIFLLPASSKFKSIKIEEGMDLQIWGVVRHAVIDVLNPRL